MDDRYNELFLAHQTACEEYDRAVGRHNAICHEQRQYEGGRGYEREVADLKAKERAASAAIQSADAKEKAAKTKLDAYAKKMR